MVRLQNSSCVLIGCLGGDQGLLNQYFSDWSKGDPSRRLPFGYNLTFCSSYSYLPAFKHFRHTIKAIHFIGSSKPWTFHRFSDGRVCPRGDYTGDHLDFVQSWWAVHDSVKGCQDSGCKKVTFAPSVHQYAYVNSIYLSCSLEVFVGIWI